MAKKKSQTLKDRIKTRRLERELSMRQAAENSKLSLSMWVYLENGTTQNPRLDTLKAVAKTLHCQIGDLVDE